MKGINMSEIEPITLSNLSRGAVDELFSREFDKVLENIADINTSPTAVRTINIKISIKPKESRENGDISIKTSATLSPAKEHSDPIYFTRQAGKHLAFQAKTVEQDELFPNVQEFNKKIL